VTAPSFTGRLVGGAGNLVRRLGKRVEIGQTPRDVVGRERRWSLMRFRRPAAAPIRFATPVLLVPSLINRWHVLDLQPQRSLIEDLVARGHDVYCVDWGTPAPEDRFLTLDDVADGAIGRALRIAGRGAPGGKVHLLGYCLGGTLAAIHAAARPQRIATLTTLAAPVDFAAAGILSTWVGVPSFDVDALVAATGVVPWQLLQASFHMLRPTLGLTKAVGLVDRAWDDEFLDGFLATERWGNDNVGLPGAFYQRYVQDLYRDNRLVRGDFALSGRPARLEAIACPVHVVTFEHDTIVPKASAVPLVERVGSPDKAHLHLSGGHVGAVVSRKAGERLWPALSRFWSERDAPPPPRARASTRSRPARPARD
jgi:polyhydroxyalkanoate synthase